MPRIERGVGYSESPYGTCEQQNLGSEQQVAKPVLALRTIFAAWNSLKNLKKEERQRRAQDAGSTEAGRDITTLRCKGSAPGYILAETTLACYRYALRCSGWQIYAAAALLTRDDRSSQREGGYSECIALSTLEER